MAAEPDEPGDAAGESTSADAGPVPQIRTSNHGSATPQSPSEVGNFFIELAERRRVLVTCLAAMFATTFTATLLTVSIRTVADDLDSSTGVIAWSVTGSLFAQAVAMPILGRIGDMRGHRRTFLIGTTFAVIFSAATALAWNPASLIAFRAAAQLAGAATIPASFAMLFMVFPPNERVRPSAWASGVLSGASVTGLAIGGLIIESVGWRAVFLMQAVIAVVPLVAAIRILPPDEGDRRLTLDKTGALILSVAVFALTFGVNRAAAWGAHPVVIVLLAAVPPLFWLLTIVERRTPVPVIPMDLLGRRDILAAGVASFLLVAAHLGNFLVTPLLLEGVFGLSVALTSLVTMCRTLSISLAAPSASWLGTRFGPRVLAAGAGGAYMVALGLLALGTQIGALWLVIVGLIGSGLAFGHAQPPLIVIASNAVPPDSFGLATSLQQTSGQIGGVIGMSLLSAIVADTLNPGPFAVAYLAAGVFALLGGIAALACSRQAATAGVGDGGRVGGQRTVAARDAGPGATGAGAKGHARTGHGATSVSFAAADGPPVLADALLAGALLAGEELAGEEVLDGARRDRVRGEGSP